MTAPLRVLIGCETSGVVRRAFAARGHDAWSCDLLPSEDRSNKHIIGDVRVVSQFEFMNLCRRARRRCRSRER